jgi:uncharacterized membrane protein YhaH (DUF805 family)
LKLSRDWVKFYTSFEGRATRYDFNVPYALVMLIGSIIAPLIDYMRMGGDLEALARNSLVSNFWNLIIIWPSLAISARRLHDLNCTGWWQAYVYVGGGLVVLLWYGLSLVMNAAVIGLLGIPVVLGVTVSYLVFLIFLSCVRGTKGTNKYGDDPLENVI